MLPVVIIGAGTVGLSIGWRLTQAGQRVALFDKGKAGRGTSWQAAGMLAPDAEIGFEELDLYALSRESLRRWPAFAEELEAASGRNVDLRTEGTFAVADDPDSAEQLRRLYDFQQEQGLDVEWLAPEEALEREPFLAPRLAGAVFTPSDYQVDNRRLVGALRAAFERAGGTLRENTPVTSVAPDGNAPSVTVEGRDGSAERVEAGSVVVAAGTGTQAISGLGALPPVRPVKGQMIELKAARPFALEHVVRGPDAYLAPKSDGRLLVGATSEERGFDQRVTAGGLFELLEGAREVVPGVDELEVTATWAGLRPAARDNAPLLGPSGLPGVVVATGHYRHGVLLTPVTADEVARLVLEGGNLALARAVFTGPLRKRPGFPMSTDDMPGEKTPQSATRLTVNGEEHALPGGADATVETLLRYLDVDPEQPGLAVAVEDEVVRRQDWSDTLLHGGERVELITAQQGG